MIPLALVTAPSSYLNRHRYFLMPLVWLLDIVLGAGVPALRADTVLKNLNPQHPRLYLDEDGFKALKIRVEKVEPYRLWYSILQRDAEAILHTPPVEHKLDGIRLLAQSRQALDRISLLAALYRLDGDPRKAERVRQEMLAAAGFPDWNPRHFLDTAEMTHALAIGYDWLHDVLSTEDRVIIRQAIVEKGLRAGQADYARNRGWPLRTNNWNQVCNGGMTIGALAIADEVPKLAREVIENGRQSIVRAMRSYAPDGGCDEGPMYWDYGTRYNVFYLSALETALGGDFGLSEAQGFSRTGEFRIHSVGSSGKPFNYGDARERLTTAPQMLWLATRFRRPEYAAHERSLVADRPDIFHLIWSSDAPSRQPAQMASTALFREIDVAFLRSDWHQSAVYVGFKAGDNRVGHSHLDLGSFVLDSQGVRWAIDLGADDYNLPGYFGDSRWTYFRLRTESHNTLTIDAENQNPRAKAPIVAFQANAERAFAVADLSDAYSDKIARLRRGIALLRGRHVLVQDEIAVKEPIELAWNMYTPAEIELEGQRAVLTIGSTKLIAHILSPADATFEIASADSPRPQSQQPHIRSLRVPMSVGKSPQRLAILLTPDGKRSEDIEIEPIDQWINVGRAD